MVTLLITRPLYEHTTHYLHFWSKKIIDFAKSRGNKVLDLSEDKVNRKNFENILRKMKPKLVLLNGHGEKDIIYGQDDKELIIAGENEDLLENKIVYVVACDKSKIAIRKNIQHLIATNSPDQFMIPDLIWNMENLECLGNQNAKLESL